MKYSNTEFPEDTTYSKTPTRTVGKITATLPEGIEVVSEQGNVLHLSNNTTLTLSCRIVDFPVERSYREREAETWRKKSKKQKGNNKFHK